MPSNHRVSSSFLFDKSSDLIIKLTFAGHLHSTIRWRANLVRPDSSARCKTRKQSRMAVPRACARPLRHSLRLNYISVWHRHMWRSPGIYRTTKYRTHPPLHCPMMSRRRAPGLAKIKHKRVEEFKGSQGYATMRRCFNHIAFAHLFE